MLVIADLVLMSVGTEPKLAARYRNVFPMSRTLLLCASM